MQRACWPNRIHGKAHGKAHFKFNREVSPTDGCDTLTAITATLQSLWLWQTGRSSAGNDPAQAGETVGAHQESKHWLSPNHRHPRTAWPWFRGLRTAPGHLLTSEHIPTSHFIQSVRWEKCPQPAPV